MAHAALRIWLLRASALPMLALLRAVTTLAETYQNVRSSPVDVRDVAHAGVLVP